MDAIQLTYFGGGGSLEIERILHVGSIYITCAEGQTVLALKHAHNSLTFFPSKGAV